MTTMDSPSPVDLRQQLAVLRDCFARMASTPLPPPARVALVEAEQAVALLERETAGGMDITVFAGLLAMAGPEVAADLLRQMLADLRAVAADLSQGLHGQNWPVIRAQTHVLAALAGAMGARDLERDARELNRVAQTTDSARCGGLGASVLEALSALIGFVETWQHQDGAIG